MALFVFATIGVHRVQASYGGLDWVVITAPNELTVTYEHTLASYDATPYSNLGLGLAGRSITGVISSTDHTVTLGFDGPPAGPNTTGSIDIAAFDWGDFPGGFLGGTAYPVDDGLIPKLGAVTLQDNDNSDGLSPGDTLSFRFNEPMREDITTETVDSYFGLGDGHSFGTAAHGLALSWNASGTTLTLTMPTDATLAPGDVVYPSASFADVAGNVMNNMPPPLEIPFTKTTPRTLYFYNAIPYAFWSDVANWWNDSAHTEQASSLPTPYDDVIIDSTTQPESNDGYYVRSLTLSPIAPDTESFAGLNFFYLSINASNGSTVNTNWNFSGTIVGDVSLSDESAAGLQYGPFGAYFGLSNIIGNVTFNGPTNANYGTIYGNTLFKGFYGNAGLIYGNTEFNDETSNPGIIFGHVVFRDTTSGGGTIYGDVDVYSPAQNPLAGVVDGTITYHGYDTDGGTGTVEDPYLISTCAELQNIHNDLTAHYKLTADIDCSESSQWNENSDEWVDGIVGGTLIPDSYAETTHTSIVVENNGYSGFEPIGTDSVFSGSLDGDGHTISHLWIFRKTTQDVGLFSHIQNATITNLTLTDSDIVGGSNTGGLVGTMDGGEISDVDLTANMVRAYLATNGGGLIGTMVRGSVDHVENTGGFVHGSGNVIGGVVGYMQDGTITDTASSAAVDGGLMIGGFVGQMNEGTITRSHASGTVTSNRSEYVVMKTGFFAGGFVGYMGAGSMSAVYATGNVSSSGNYAGGFAGYASSIASISEAYATGDVAGVEETVDINTVTPLYVGGFVGFTSSPHLYKTYATGDVSSAGDYTGGYAGYGSTTTIHDAYAAGTVQGQAHVGGFVGYLTSDSDMSHVYARGAISGTDTDTTHGLVGASDGDFIPTNSFWDTQTGGQSTIGSPSEKTTAEMKTQSTFTDAGWDFDTIWTFAPETNSGYPVLRFSLTPTISSTSPSDSATSVSTTTPIVIHFSTPMNTDSVVISNSECGYACSTYTQEWSDSNQTLTLTKTGDPFVRGATYTISITTAYTAGGIAMSAPYTWSFTIESEVVAPPQTPTHRGPSGGSIFGRSAFASTPIPVIHAAQLVPTTPTPTACSVVAYPTAPIRLGVANDPEQVKLLEQYLNTYEHANLAVDGVYSVQDKNAVIAWQEKYATDILVPQHMTKGTGIVGAKSLQKIKQQALVQCPQSGIDKSSAIRTTHTALVRDLKVGMSGADVRTLQQALITKMVGPLARALAAHKPTGYFGSLTKRALVEFQTSVGIAPATGGYGSKTRAVLKI